MKTSVSTRAMALLLASLSALGPFSIDTYLPSFLEIGQSLAATPVEVQQTLTAYLLPFAFMALWHGSISDALGRRSVVLWALGIFGLASLGCVFVTRIDQLWCLRAVQGMSAGAGIVVGRAIVRDLFDGPEAQRLMSHVAMTFALAPAVAPVIGGWLHSWFGWRSVFVFLTVLTALLFLVSWRHLPETLPPEKRQSLRPAYLGRAYWSVMTSPAFLTAGFAISLNFVAFFIYIMSAPVFLIRHLGVSEREFLWLFGPAMAGLMLGSWISGRLAGKIPLRRTIRHAYLVMGGAALVNLGLNAALPPGLPWSVLPIFAYTTGMALATPCLTILALDLFPSQRGLAASCQTFMQSALNALAAGLLAPLLWGSTLTLALGMAAILLAGALASYLHLRLTSARTLA